MRRRAGFSLMEMMVACSVAAIVLLSVVGIFGLAVRQSNTQVTRSQAMIEANQAADAMAAEIATGASWSSGTLTLPAPPAGSTTGGGGGGLLGGLLGLGGGGGSSPSGTQVQYFLGNWKGKAGGGGVLWRQYLPSGGSWTLDNAWSCLPGGPIKGGNDKYPNVTSLSFSSATANIVQLSVTVSSTQNGQTSSYTATRNVYLSCHS